MKFTLATEHDQGHVTQLPCDPGHALTVI